MVSSTLHLVHVIGNSYVIHIQFGLTLSNLNHTHCRLSLSLDHHSGRSTHRVVNTTTRGSTYSKLIFLIYFSRQIDFYTNTVLTILTRSTTGPVNFLFYFCSVPHRVVNAQPGIQTLKHLIFQIVQYTEYHCIRVQKILASKSTGTKQLSSHFSSTL